MKAITLIGAVLLLAPAASAQDPAPLAPGAPEGWAGLAIVAVSVLTAWLMNYTAPRVRVLGTALAAAGCLALAGWFFFYVLGTGFLENPKPNQTQLDNAKPFLLWSQALVALLAGAALLWAAVRQTRDQERLALPTHNEPGRYGLVSRLLHWTIAVLFIALIPMGIFTSMIPEDTPYRNAYYVVHKSIGVLVFLLILVRLMWNRMSTRPALDPSLKPWEAKLAHRVHLALYGFMIAVPVTGYVMTSYHGFPTYFFFFEVAPLWEKSDAYIVWGTFHKYILPYLLYIVLGAHILGALKHRFIDNHKQAFKRMAG